MVNLTSCSLFISSAKNIFRVRFHDPSQGQSHTLQVNDVFHKQQWLNCLRSAISVHHPAAVTTPASSPAADAHSKRHSSKISSIIHTEEADENCPLTPAGATSASSSLCGDETPSPTSTSPSSRSSSSSSSPLSSPSPKHKTKKDKRSLCALGKRKETMV